MTQSLEQYVAEAMNAYKPSTTAVQGQLDALGGQLEATNANINRNYGTQADQIDRARNDSYRQAVIDSAGAGSAFGGRSNIAQRKYTQQQYVPAITQMQTNKANELENARQNSENQRLSLNNQLSSIQAQANNQALAQYYADLEAERERQLQLELQRQQTAAQNAYYQYLMEAMKQQNNAPQQTYNKRDISFADWLSDDRYGAIDSMFATSNMNYNDKVKMLQDNYNLFNKYGGNEKLYKIAGGLSANNLLAAYNKWRNS